VLVLKTLIESQLSSVAPGTSKSLMEIISRLARKIDDIRHPRARACVIWLVSQYAATDDKDTAIEGVVDWAPDLLRKTAKSFANEVSSSSLLPPLSLTSLDFGREAANNKPRSKIVCSVARC
jgi:AP-3 complex subunit beta